MTSVTKLNNLFAANKFKGLSILVVEPLANMRAILSTMLDEMGCANVYQAGTVEDALSAIKRRKVDVVLAERQFRRGDGMQILENLRQSDEYVQVPFVMMSTLIQQSQVIKAIKCGVSEYLVKPFSAKMLKDRIERAISFHSNTSLAESSNHDDIGEASKSDMLSVLIVDDAPDNIRLMSNILNEEFKVKAATSGEAAIKACKGKHPPDLILLDIMMPGMSGIEVCKKLKSDPFTQHITVIFLTALDSDSDIIDGLELGAVDYMTKPVKPSIVKARVNTHAKLINTNKLMRDQIDTMMENNRLKRPDSILKSANDELLALIDALKSFEMDKEKRKDLKVHLDGQYESLVNKIMGSETP